MKIKILCSEGFDGEKLEENICEAIRQMGVIASLEVIIDTKSIIRHGVVRTPAMIVDDRLHFQGRIASVEDIKYIIQTKDQSIG